MEVAAGVEVVRSGAIHEEVVSDAKDLHAFDADAFECFKHLWPNVAVVLLVFGDDGRIVFEVKDLCE